MKSMGYTKFKNIDCVFYEESDAIRLIPVNHNEKIVKFINERDLVLTYNRNINKCTAFIKRADMCFDDSIRLVPKYIFETIGEIKSIHGFSIVGDAIDDFFNPTNYFSRKKINGETIGNVIYEREIVDCWKIKLEENFLTISLSYGEILKSGRRSDLMLHPKLNINFQNNTSDLEFIYRAYKVVVMFIQLVRYDLDIGWYSMTLVDERGFECGKFYELDNPHMRSCVGHQMELNYITYKPFIGRLFQFVANNQTLSLNHLPQATLRANLDDYEPMICVSIFGAFEDECRENKEAYIKSNIVDVKNIRMRLMTEVNKILKSAQTKDEKHYIGKVISRIGTTDTSVGLKRKIVNAYHTLFPAIQSSVPNIFYLYSNEKKDSFSIEKIADNLSELRGTIAHGEFNRKFTAEEIHMVYFLEVLVYSQLLKRARLQDAEIELILGIVFNCNEKYLKIV